MTLKIWIKRSLIVLIALLVFYAVARFITVYAGSMIEGERAAYLQVPTSHSIIVRWQTSAETTGSVHYGTSLHQLDKTAVASEPANLHSVQIDGLEPDTRYYYAIATTSANGHSEGYNSDARNWFQTLPRAGERPARLWVMGDSGYAGPVADKVRDAAIGWMAAHARDGYPDLDVWLALGDIAYTSGTDQQYQVSLFETYRDQLRSHALWPVYGNHDDRRWTYFKIFTLPEKAESGGEPSGTDHYYSFDYGDIHFVVLDSQDSPREQADDMLQWLERDLAENKSKWLIAAFHHPPYSKGTHDSDKISDSGGRMTDMRKYALPILEAAGADLVLSGHSHMYERSYLMACHYGTSDSFSKANIVSEGVTYNNALYLKPAVLQADSGTVYVVAGSASKVDKGSINHPALPVSMLEAGSLVIDIDGDQLTSRFINSAGEVRDEFTIRKQAGYQSGHPACKH